MELYLNCRRNRNILICNELLANFEDSITYLELHTDINQIIKEFFKPNALKRLERLYIDAFSS